jgi:hypothetical protein
MKNRINLKGMQSFLVRNEKEIIQIMLAAVLITYMIIQRFAG